MPTWIRIINWAVIRIRVPIPRLYPLLLRYQCIRLNKPPRRGVIPSRPVIIQPQRAFQSLPGEMVRRRRRPAAIPLRPPRVIAYLSAHRPAAAGGDRLAAEVVSQRVI